MTKLCPLLKIKQTTKSGNGQSSVTEEMFQDCIKEKCTAWDSKENCCQYFTMNRYIKQG